MFEDFDSDLDLTVDLTCNQGEAATFTEICKKCAGKGRYMHFGACYACKGVGSFERKTSPEARAKAKAQRVNKVERDRTANVERFAVEHVAQYQWMVANPNFEFAQSMLQAVAKYGYLTERQAAAVESLMARSAERAAQRAGEQAAQNARAQAINVEPVVASLTHAKEKGLRRPVLRLAELAFSFAPDTGRNAGAVYVKSTDGAYLGKIAAGQFSPSRECSQEQQATVIDVAQRPAEAAVEYGRMTGSCACCGRTLTDKTSVERGIGPVCAEKFGF